MVHISIERCVVFATMSVVDCNVYFAFDLTTLIASRINLCTCFLAFGSLEHTIDFEVDLWLCANAVPKNTSEVDDIFFVASSLDDEWR